MYKNQDGTIKINNELLKEKLGFEINFDNWSQFSGLSRDNGMFDEIFNWYKDGAEKVEIIPGANGRYCFQTTNGDTVKQYNFNTTKSFYSRLFDFALLDPAYAKQLELDNEQIFEYFLNNPFSPKIAIKNLISENKDELYKYWKSLSTTSNNYFTSWVIPRLRTIAYHWVRHIWDIKELNVVAEKTDNCKRLDILISTLYSKVISIEPTETEKKQNEQIAIEVTEFEKTLSNDKHHYDPSLEIVMGLFQKGEWVIPVFQREYVWKQNKVIKLLNSIYFKYPIGSVLVAKSDVHFEDKNPLIKAITSRASKSDRFVVLDGQQRLTSIARVLMYEQILRNVKSSAGNPEVRKIIDETNDICFFEEGIEVFGGPFVSAKELKNSDFTQFKKIEDTEPYKLKRQNVREKAKEVIKNYDLSATIISQTSIGDLINIFQSINTGSQNLTNLDLLNSLFYGYNQEYTLLESLKAISARKLIEDYDVSNEAIIQCWKLLHDFEHYNMLKEDEKSDFTPSLQIKDLFKLVKTKSGFENKFNLDNFHDVDHFMQMSDRVEIALQLTIKALIEVVGISEFKALPNNAFLLNVCAFIIQAYGDTFEENLSYKEYDFNSEPGFITNIKTIIRVTIKRTLLKDYTAGTSGKINQDIKWIMKGMDASYEQKIDERVKNWDDQLIPAFDKLEYGDASSLYKLFMAHLVNQKPVSLVDGTTEVAVKFSLFKEVNKNMHHFVPDKFHGFDEYVKDIKNKVQNIFLISAEENNSTINNKSPLIYLAGIANDPTKIKKIAETHLLNEVDLDTFLKTESPIELKAMLKNRHDNIFNSFKNYWNF